MSDPYGTIGNYRKGGSMSFLENENQMVVDTAMSEISDWLLENWINNNLDEGQLYSDWCIADMVDNNYLKERFNQFYDLNPNDQYYLEWDENV